MKIGLIAGNGQFPLLFADAATKNGHTVIAVAHTGETNPLLEEKTAALQWIKVGQLEKTFAFFKSHGVENAVMAGGLSKENILANFEPDDRALSVIARVPDLNDDRFLRALAEEYESAGIAIRESTLYTPELLSPEGVLTEREPSEMEKADVDFGWRIAKELGKLDVGQCVVVKKLTVLAMEAIDGSNETIRRGGRLGREGSVVVKICKPTQDVRFDLPSVGLETIEVMKEAGAAVLAVEAGKTLIFDREDMISAADEAGICILARKDD